MTEKLDGLLDPLEPRLREYRRDFHAHAETGWNEYRTSALVARRLDELGFRLRVGPEVVAGQARMGLPPEEVMEARYRRALDEGAPEKYAEKFRHGFTGLTGEIGRGEGPTVGFRFDMDALEVEEKGTEDHRPAREGFASIHREAMHACGHDGHTAIGLGLAEALARMRDRLSGRVRLIFQPAEEGARGARAMVEAGVVDDLDRIYGLHIGAKALTTGEFCCGTDGFLATSKFDIFFYGQAAHAGFDPQNGRNALLAAANAVVNLYAISRHGGGGTRINVGKISGGSGRNIIPEEARLQVETRGETTQIDRYMAERAAEVAKGAAEMGGVRCEILRMGEAAAASSDADLAGRVYRLAQKRRIFPLLREREPHFGGSEDFSLMMERVRERGGKACYFLLGSELAGSHHSPGFDFNEEILIKGVEILALVALEPAED